MKQKFGARLLCVLIAFLLLAGLVPFGGAEAALSPFTDVGDSDYYADQIISMSRRGVVSGYGDGRFLPQNPVKNSEAIKLVLSMAGVDYAGCSGKTDPWYSDCMEWAYANGIVDRGIDPNASATRAQFADYILRSYRIDSKTSTNVFSDTSSQTANKLYDLGIISGIPNADGTVSFGGSQNVKRGDSCIMLYRLDEKVSRPNWSDAVKPTPVFTLDYSHYSPPKPLSLNTYDDFISAWRWMLVNVSFKQQFSSNLTCKKSDMDTLIDNLLDSYNYAMFDYMDFSSFLREWSVYVDYLIDGSGNCTNLKFTLSIKNADGIPNNTIAQQINQFKQTCANIVTGLYSSGQLSTKMSNKEKAHVLYVYTALNTQYDTSYTKYTGYDAAVGHKAVCQGYVGMYNYLCNLAGVPMRGMTGIAGGGSHAWSRINEGGVWYNIDTTWADPTPDRPGYYSDEWFWLTDGQMKSGKDARSFDIDSLGSELFGAA